jgi:hypothetical protein
MTNNKEITMNPTPIHPKLPFGLGSQISLTGFIGAIVAFITAWQQDGLTPETTALGLAAAGILAAWFAGRSIQAKAAIETAVGAYVGAQDQGDAGGVPPPPAP